VPSAPRREPGAAPAGAVVRAARKEVARVERALDRLTTREAELHDAMAGAATDHVRLGGLQGELEALRAERDALEAAWLEQSELLER
jgi:ATP-binding cassette subfamily F protein uup